MLTTGVVSVTFRPLLPDQILSLASQAGLDGVEWGSDVHVPVGDFDHAARVGQMTCAAHLRTVSYGSYFKAGYSDPASFADVIATAKALSAPNIRIWAGERGSEAEKNRTAVADSIRACAAACSDAGMTVSLEFHPGTLTDHYESARRLVEEVAHDNLRLYWQPNQFRDEAYNLAALRAVLPYLSHVHVFAWEGSGKYPLAQHERIWREYIDILRGSPNDHAMLMEFVCDGSQRQFFEDAQTLHLFLEK